MYKTLRKIHLWLSVPFGLIISLMCATGFILLFEAPHAKGADRPEFFLDVMRLHRWLMDAPAEKGAMSGGKLIVGITVVAMVVILITGIWMWWLRARRAPGMNLKIRFNKGWHAFCSSLHIAGGAYVMLFLLVMALTGLTWSFGWYRAGFNSLFGIEKGSHIVYAIHTGLFGGHVTQIIWGIAALIGLTLPLTGYYLWLKKVKSKK